MAKAFMFGVGLWDVVSRGLWNFGTFEPSKFWTLELLYFGTLGLLNFRFRFGDAGTLGFWHAWTLRL